MSSFKKQYLENKAEIGQLDDFVDEWHKNSKGISLQEFLGFSDQEYAAFGGGEKHIKKILDRCRIGYY